MSMFCGRFDRQRNLILGQNLLLQTLQFVTFVCFIMIFYYEGEQICSENEVTWQLKDWKFVLEDIVIVFCHHPGFDLRNL